MKKFKSSGFTVLELIVALAVLITIGILGFVNIHDLQASNRDKTAKTDINVIYYQLQAFHQTNNYYPEDLTNKTLPGLAPEVLKDSRGIEINQFGSRYSYQPINCQNGKCKSYQLKAQLEKEPTYEKTGQ
jgi:type II secretory pathway pseudopilin PulG